MKLKKLKILKNLKLHYINSKLKFLQKKIEKILTYTLNETKLQFWHWLHLVVVLILVENIDIFFFGRDLWISMRLRCLTQLWIVYIPHPQFFSKVVSEMLK